MAPASRSCSKPERTGLSTAGGVGDAALRAPPGYARCTAPGSMRRRGRASDYFGWPSSTHFLIKSYSAWVRQPGWPRPAELPEAPHGVAKLGGMTSCELTLATRTRISSYTGSPPDQTLVASV